MQDESGASAVEYGLLLAGIAALVIAVVFLFGQTALGLFETTCTSVDAAAAQAGSALTC